MCGILGGFRYDNDVNIGSVISALEQLNHRGPDDSGYQDFIINKKSSLILLFSKTLIIR